MIIRQKQVLTPTLAEFCFRVQWQMLAEIDDSANKYSYKVKIAERLAEHFNLGAVQSACFLCEMLLETYGGVFCDHCPVTWAKGPETKAFCKHIHSLYTHWQYNPTKNIERAYAKKNSNATI
jgi:beta-galactosidase GanA